MTVTVTVTVTVAPPLRSMPCLVVAGAASNVGKTTVTVGLIAALRQRGLRVQPFKCGPDYIDPSYHERAAGRPCRNLDAWMLDDQQLLQGFTRACRDADMAVIEGVMGLFDGCGWEDERGSTAHIAKLLNAPVVLVVDIAGAARSAAVAVLGCQHFDPALLLRGVLLNFAGSESHANGCGAAIAATTGLPSLGWLPRAARLAIPERHLGLVPGGEHAAVQTLIEAITVEFNQRCDVAALVEIAHTAASPAEPAPLKPAHAEPAYAEPAHVEPAHAEPAPAGRGKAYRRTRSRPVVAVARDEAFCFYYPENLELLAEAGAAIEFFEPLRGECPARRPAGMYLGGGYPELHGKTLSANSGLWDMLRDLHARNAPIYAECGGFMVLTEGLIDGHGHQWPMAGLVPGVARMTSTLAALGYRHATALQPNLLTDGQGSVRGHEFRYSRWERSLPPTPDHAAWTVKGTRGHVAADSAGHVRGNLLASYLHVHFAQSAAIATRFVHKLRSPEELSS